MLNTDWEATNKEHNKKILAYQSYHCGIVRDIPLNGK